MKTFHALVLIALYTTVYAAVEDSLCPTRGRLYAVEQLATRARIASQPTCPVDGSHDVAGAEILSFEEWKALQLELQQQSNGSSSTPTTTAVAATADSSATPSPTEPDETANSNDAASVSENMQVPVRPPSLKDRYNYASTDCSARITSSHRGARSPDSILSHKKDRYMLSPCDTPKQHVVVELCDDIRIDTVQLANFEFFSGVFRSIAVKVSADGVDWENAGEYEAKNVRGVQSFHPSQDLPNFYRYVRIDFLSHYGNEYYCPVSLLRVYGLTQMEKFKRELAEEQGRATPTAEPQPPVVSTAARATPEEDKQSKETDAPTPTPTPTRGTSDVALRPSIALADLEKCATYTASSGSVSSSSTHAPDHVVTTVLSQSPTSTTEPATISSPASAATSSASTKITASAPTPKISLTAGDSIYRTIMNRLTQLEANSTLVIRFVEQQTLSIREALRRLEEDVGRLDGVTKAQQTLFARTLNELERERRALDEERALLLHKLANLTDEVVLEKRLGIAQLALLVAVLLFLAVTRGSAFPLPLPRSRAPSIFHRRVMSEHIVRPRAAAIEPPPRPPSRSPAPTPTPVPFPRRSPRDTPSTAPITTASRPLGARAYGHGPRSSGSRPRTPTLRSGTTSASVSTSRARRAQTPDTEGRRLARTAHLHEVRRSPNPVPSPRQQLASPSPTPEPEAEIELEDEAWVTDDEPLGVRGVEEGTLAVRRRAGRSKSSVLVGKE